MADSANLGAALCLFIAVAEARQGIFRVGLLNWRLGSRRAESGRTEAGGLSRMAEATDYVAGEVPLDGPKAA
jgi:hypothetical protein